MSPELNMRKRRWIMLIVLLAIIVFVTTFNYGCCGGGGASGRRGGKSKPNALSNLIATAVSSSQIDIAWTDNSTNEDGFKIECKTEVPTDETKTNWVWTEYTEIATVGAGITSYSHTGLVSSRPYTYRVRAFNAAGDSDYSIEATAYAWPDTPLNLTATTVSHKEVHLQWTNVSDHYTLNTIIESSTDGVNYLPVWMAGLNDEVNDRWLDANTTCYYRAKACQSDSAGESGYSNIASATTLVLTIPEASARVTGLYNAQLITGTDLYNFLIDHLNSANTFYTGGDFDGTITELTLVMDKILDETANNIELISGLLLHDYVTDLLFGVKREAGKPFAGVAQGVIDAHAKREIDKTKKRTDLSEDEKKNRIAEINGITTTAHTALAPPDGYGTISAKHSVVIQNWGVDWISNAANGISDTPTAVTGYGGAGITVPSEWTKTNGIYEIPKTTPPPDGRGWSQSLQTINVVVTGTGTAGCVIRTQPVPCPQRATTNNYIYMLSPAGADTFVGPFNRQCSRKRLASNFLHPPQKADYGNYRYAKLPFAAIKKWRPIKKSKVLC